MPTIPIADKVLRPLVEAAELILNQTFMGQALLWDICPAHVGNTKEGVTMPDGEVGHVSDFFAHPVSPDIDPTDNLKLGDTICIVGHTTNLEMVMESIHLNSANVSELS